MLITTANVKELDRGFVFNNGGRSIGVSRNDGQGMALGFKQGHAEGLIDCRPYKKICGIQIGMHLSCC